MNDIIVELKDGRRFEYDSDKTTAETVVDDLIAKGVKKGEIKNTFHIIPREVMLKRLLEIQWTPDNDGR
jgi:hypothetical protein